MRQRSNEAEDDDDDDDDEDDDNGDAQPRPPIHSLPLRVSWVSLNWGKENGRSTWPWRCAIL
ncbi:hypothetical protein ACMD2_06342 [Ananas comosus]|uniref:Uncharacterized protein n=1 Tax=Ananas comosus TaxID=4615 RepID=A0A199W0W0_ANACO|nr:hypothetical protein ACMD2_06342 [Ananas comosus]